MGSFASAFAFPLGGDSAETEIETVATLALDADNAKLTYEWRTDVMTAWSGKEQRVSLIERPRQRYELTSVLSDEQQRLVTAQLGRNVPDGAAFLLGLPWEEATITSVSGATVGVTSLAYLDWAVAGTRIVIVRNGATGTARIDSVDSLAATITLDTDLSGSVAAVGARIMPGVPAYLDAQQSFSRYAVNAGEWTLSAIGALFRWSNTLPGAGATLTTFDSLPVWDVGIQTAQASQPLHAGVDAQDLGFSTKQLYRWDEAQWGRALRVETTRGADVQWLKLFLHTVKGRARAFLLPSGRPDLIPIGDASTGTLEVSDANDYVTNWWPSLAHRRLKLVRTDGSFEYRTVTAASAGLGGAELTLSSSLAGALSRVEFLEQVRLDSDTAMLAWTGGVMSCDLVARVVQR